MALLALARFAAAYADPDAIVGEAVAAGQRPVRTVGIDVPFGLLRAKGYQPVRLFGVQGATPRADAIMGGKGLGPRGRGLLEAILAPAHPGVPLLVTAADAEQVQLFATLRELARLGEAELPPIFLLDLIHQPRAASRDYARRRLAQCAAWLDTLGAAPAGEIAPGVPDPSARLSGLQRLHVAGCAAILPADEHRALCATLVAAQSESGGVRLFVAGSLHEDDRFYAAIEAAGATVVGEDHGWGERFLNGPVVPPASEQPRAVAARVAAAVRRCGATHVLHLTTGNDEAAPWQVAPLRSALGAVPLLALTASLPDERFAGRLRAFLAGDAAPAAPPPTSRPAPSGRPPRETRSRKALASLVDFGRYQRDWFAGIRARAAAGEPAYPLAPFHPEAVNGLIGTVRWHEDGRLNAGFVPIWNEPPGSPTLPDAARRKDVARYIDEIGGRAGLPPLAMRWDGRRIALDPR